MSLSEKEQDHNWIDNMITTSILLKKRDGTDSSNWRTPKINTGTNLIARNHNQYHYLSSKNIRPILCRKLCTSTTWEKIGPRTKCTTSATTTTDGRDYISIFFFSTMEQLQSCACLLTTKCNIALLLRKNTRFLSQEQSHQNTPRHRLFIKNIVISWQEKTTENVKVLAYYRI